VWRWQNAVRFRSREFRSVERSQSAGRWKRSLHRQNAQTPAPLHWVVIVRFTKVDFPIQARQPIEANGGKCIAAWECAYGNNFVGVLLAEEPSGDSGELERHLSVSASTACIRRMPKRKEMRAALDAAGMSGEAQMQVGNNVIHIFQPLVSSR